MPQLLQNVDNLYSFVTKFGFKVRDLSTGIVAFDYTPKELCSNLDETPSTSDQNWYKSKIITGEMDSYSISSEDTNFTETNSPPTTPKKNGN